MAKPILVVTMPEFLSPEESLSIIQTLEKQCPDYNVLLTHGTKPGKEVKFQVFYEKDQIPIDYDELRKLITNKMKS